MNLVLLGAPGAGKGTQASLISKKLNIPIISTGDLIRDKIEDNDAVADTLKSYVNEGKLVPDKLVGDILRARVSEPDCRFGFILDGFPRSLSQAKLLDELQIEVDKVIGIEVSDKEIVKRLQSRRICKNCKKVYNLLSIKPRVEGRCDDCNQELMVRQDDNLQVIENRLKVFHEETQPVEDFYKKSGKYFQVFGEDEIQKIEEQLLEIIGDGS